MASHSPQKAADDAKQSAAAVAKRAVDAVDAQRERVAGAIDDAADGLENQGKKSPNPIRDYADTAKDKLHDAAEYVRDTGAEQMGKDAVGVVRDYPVGTLLVVGAVLIGGSLLVAALTDHDRAPARGADSAVQSFSLASAAKGLGPKSIETLTRLRDAAFSFALAKAIDAAEDMFPGFREHFEKA